MSSTAFRTALITGASSGLGEALARWFVARGTRVFAAARRVDRLEALRQALPAGSLEPVALDVTRPDDVRSTLERLDDASGGLDLVVANAGIGESGPVARVGWESVARTLDVNVTGAAATLSCLVPRMVARRRGHLVGVSSLAAYRGVPGSAAYCASKAFLSTFLEALRVELRGSGVRVTTLQPGFVKSELTAQNRSKMPFLLETADAADRMGRAIVRADAVFDFPWQMAFAVRLASVLPDAWLRRVARQSQVRSR